MDDRILSGSVVEVGEGWGEYLAVGLAVTRGRPDEESGGGVVEADVQAGDLTWNLGWGICLKKIKFFIIHCITADKIQ